MLNFLIIIFNFSSFFIFLTAVLCILILSKNLIASTIFSHLSLVSFSFGNHNFNTVHSKELRFFFNFKLYQIFEADLIFLQVACDSMEEDYLILTHKAIFGQQVACDGPCIAS